MSSHIVIAILYICTMFKNLLFLAGCLMLLACNNDSKKSEKAKNPETKKENNDPRFLLIDRYYKEALQIFQEKRYDSISNDFFRVFLFPYQRDPIAIRLNHIDESFCEFRTLTYSGSNIKAPKGYLANTDCSLVDQVLMQADKINFNNLSDREDTKYGVADGHFLILEMRKGDQYKIIARKEFIDSSLVDLTNLALKNAKHDFRLNYDFSKRY